MNRPPVWIPLPAGISGILSDSLLGRGVTVFVTTHYMDEAQHCNRVVIINEGRIVAHGAPLDIIADVLPESPGADLNDAFVKLMRRSGN